MRDRPRDIQTGDSPARLPRDSATGARRVGMRSLLCAAAGAVVLAVMPVAAAAGSAAYGVTGSVPASAVRADAPGAVLSGYDGAGNRHGEPEPRHGQDDLAPLIAAQPSATSSPASQAGRTRARAYPVGAPGHVKIPPPPTDAAHTGRPSPGASSRTLMMAGAGAVAALVLLLVIGGRRLSGMKSVPQ